MTIRKGYVYDFKYMTFWKRQNTGDCKEISGYKHWEEREMSSGDKIWGAKNYFV